MAEVKKESKKEENFSELGQGDIRDLLVNHFREFEKVEKDEERSTKFLEIQKDLEHKVANGLNLDLLLNLVNWKDNNTPGGNPVRVFDPDENDPEHPRVPSHPDDDKDDKELKPEQITAKKKRAADRQKFEKKHNEQRFYIELMRRVLDQQYEDNKRYVCASVGKQKSKLKAWQTRANQRALRNQLSHFSDFCDNILDGHTSPINKDLSDSLYIFKAKVLVNNLMADPSNPKKLKDCLDLAKKLDGSARNPDGKIKWKEILIGLAIIAVCLTLIGVTSGIAAGAIVVPFIAISAIMGKLTVVGLFTSFTFMGAWFGFKNRLYPNIPAFNHKLSWQLNNTAKKISKKSAQGDRTNYELDGPFVSKRQRDEAKKTDDSEDDKTPVVEI